MGKATRSAAELNEFLTTYSEEYVSKVLTNQSFTVSPLLDHMLADAKEVSGGYEIVVPVMDAYTSVGGWVERGAQINLTHVDPFTTARYRWKFRDEPAYLDWTDEQQTEGDGAMLRYVEEELENTMGRYYEGLAVALVAASTETSGFTSLLEIIDSAGAIGGLNPATTGQTFWASYETNSIGSFQSNGIPELRRAMRETSKYKGLGRVTGIFCSKTFYDQYEASGLNLSTLMATGGRQSSADLGIEELAYKRIPVVYEPHLDTLEATTASLNGVALGINNRWLKTCKKPGDPFKFHGWVDMLPAGRLGRGGVLKCAVQNVAWARSPHFKLTGVTA